MAVRRHHLAAALAGRHALTLVVANLAVRARNPGQRNWTDRSGRIDGRFHRRHGRQASGVAKADLRQRARRGGRVRRLSGSALRALAGVGPGAIIIGLRLARPRIAAQEGVIGLLDDLHRAGTEAVVLRRTILAVPVPPLPQVGDERSVRQVVDSRRGGAVVVADDLAARLGDRRRRRATAAAPSEVLLQSADRVLEARAGFAADLPDALLEVAGALRDADRVAGAGDRADQVGCDAGGVEPALD